MKLPGTGAVKRPPEKKVKDWAARVTPGNTIFFKEDTLGNRPGCFSIPDVDQGSGSTCTTEVLGHGFQHTAGIAINKEDVYSGTVLPGGGSYPNSPMDYVKKNGYVLASSYPDPYPQTEQNMAQLIIVEGIDRIRAFVIQYWFYPLDINSAALAMLEHDFLSLSVFGSWSNGWNKSWVDPTYNKVWSWLHNIFSSKEEGICARNGIPAIKCKSNWSEHIDYLGQTSYCHFINQDYFDNGGVHEVIGVDLKELTMEIKQVVGEATLVFQNYDGKYYELATKPELYTTVSQIFGLEDKDFTLVTRDEVNANLAGKATMAENFDANHNPLPGLTFTLK